MWLTDSTNSKEWLKKGSYSTESSRKESFTCSQIPFPTTASQWRDTCNLFLHFDVENKILQHCKRWTQRETDMVRKKTERETDNCLFFFSFQDLHCDFAVHSQTRMEVDDDDPMLMSSGSWGFCCQVLAISEMCDSVEMVSNWLFFRD